MDMHTVYGICHNVVKLEEYTIKNKKKKLYVHRKGATRSFPDQPVLLAGSMGTASYILKGTEKAMESSFGSSAHGAGRAMSRHEALRQFRGEQISNELLNKKGIVTKATSWKSLAEEAPGAYKDVENVIDSVHNSGISLKVTRLEPLGVIKG
jgi:tRNA-splicing ligase RtcB